MHYQTYKRFSMQVKKLSGTTSKFGNNSRIRTKKFKMTSMIGNEGVEIIPKIHKEVSRMLNLHVQSTWNRLHMSSLWETRVSSIHHLISADFTMSLRAFFFRHIDHLAHNFVPSKVWIFDLLLEVFFQAPTPLIALELEPSNPTSALTTFLARLW
jgi:hypothetical protein